MRRIHTGTIKTPKKMKDGIQKAKDNNAIRCNSCNSRIYFEHNKDGKYTCMNASTRKRHKCRPVIKIFSAEDIRKYEASNGKGN